MKSVTRGILLFIGLVVVVAACKKEDTISNIYLSETNIEFDYDENSFELSISNLSDSDITWSISSQDDFFSFSEDQGNCKANYYAKVDINLNRATIQIDSLESKITIKTSLGDSETIDVFIYSFPEKKISFQLHCNDAAFDPINNKLLLTWNNLSYCTVIDILTKASTDIELEKLGGLCDINPQTKKAYITSSQGSVMEVDLATNKQTKTFNCSSSYYTDIICTDNNRVLLFPDYYYAEIGIIDLATGICSSHTITNLGGDFLGEMHPSGKYVYGCDNSELLKIDISSDEPTLVYSTYSYNMDDILWVSADGEKLFSFNSEVLYIEPDLAGDDITLVEDIDLTNSYLYSISQNLVKNEYYVISTNNYYYNGSGSETSYIEVYNSDFEQTETISLENFFEVNYSQNPYTEIEPEGRFVFNNATGDKMIVISQKGSGYYSGTGIEIFDRTK